MPSSTVRLQRFVAKALFFLGSLFGVVMLNYFALTTSRIIWVATLFSLLTLLALVVLYKKYLSTRLALAGCLGSLMIAALVAVIWAAPTLAQPRDFASGGAVDWSPQPYITGTGHATVYHVGRYPLGGFTNYHAGLHVTWKDDPNNWQRLSTDFSAVPYVDNEEFVDYNASDFQVKAYLYSCEVRGITRWHGCLYAYAKFKLTVSMPLKGQFKTVYPWVKIWINVQGGVFKWDWSKGLM